MWYRFTKTDENPSKIVYDYSYASKEMTGVLEFNKKTEEITFPKLALNDDGTQVNRFGGALRRKILDEKYPDSIYLAFG